MSSNIYILTFLFKSGREGGNLCILSVAHMRGRGGGSLQDGAERLQQGVWGGGHGGRQKIPSTILCSKDGAERPRGEGVGEIILPLGLNRAPTRRGVGGGGHGGE